MNTADSGNNQSYEGGPSKEAPKCRLRFKGIENFLRRVAFNLGNTPSQTEVKIISCIPIDVTDLQYKILTLEKELEECHHRLLQDADAAVVRTALVPQPRFPRPPSARPARPATPPRLHSLHSLHSLLPAVLSHDSHYAASLSSSHDILTESSMLIPLDKTPECRPTSSVKDIQEDMQKSQIFSEHDRFRKILKKMKKLKKKRECNTHLVYYANTCQSPFQNYKISTSSTSKPQTKEAISRSFLDEVIRKQYKPDRLNDRTDLSQFSSPVCRDVPLSSPSVGLLDSDMCSCCHGPFQDLDKSSLPSHEVFTHLPLTDNSINTNVYYDSSLYDLVPVKEKSTKIKKDEEIVKKNEAKPYDGRYDKRLKYVEERYNHRFQPYVVNYHLTSVRNTKKPACKRKSPAKFATRKPKSKTEIINVSSTVDCGAIYMRPSPQRTHARKVSEPVPRQQTEMKNAECLTISVNNTECQTSSTKSVQLDPETPVEDKTEETLNQIKTILQCVLTEVKTSAQMKPAPIEKCLKDAVVQKGVSQNDVQACSSLMNTYSPYNTNQHFMPSCSRQNNQVYYPPITGVSGGICPTRCLQNYPLFIQTNGRQCTCCFRNTGAKAPSRAPPVVHAPPASRGDSRVSATPRQPPLTTAATNTEGDGPSAPTRSKETDTLIKEIYKSLAINLDYPPNGSSASGYDGSSTNSKKVFDFKYVPNSAKSKDTSSNASNRGTQETATTTSTPRTPIVIDTMVGSDSSSEMASVQSGRRGGMHNDRIQNYMVKKETRLTSESDRERQLRSSLAPGGRLPGSRLPPRPGARFADTSRSDTESDPDSDDTIVPDVKPGKPSINKKKGLFSKMVKYFKSKPKRTRRQSESESEMEMENIEEEASESDSDDYQTVYSKQSKKKHVHYEADRPRRYRRKVHSKISNSKKISQRDRQYERQRRSPYMEQEYRRHWTEDIGFHGGYTPRYSTDRPTSDEFQQPRTIPPQHYQAYGASTHLDQQPMPFKPDVPMNQVINASQPGPSKGPVEFHSALRKPTGPEPIKPKPKGMSVSIGPKTPLPKYDASMIRTPRKWTLNSLKTPKCLGNGEQWKKFIFES